jgi:hypothetical protein
VLWQGNTLGDWLQKNGTRNTQVVNYIEVFSNDISNLATHESIPMTIMPEGRIVWFGGGGGESNSQTLPAMYLNSRQLLWSVQRTPSSRVLVSRQIFEGLAKPGTLLQ